MQIRSTTYPELDSISAINSERAELDRLITVLHSARCEHRLWSAMVEYADSIGFEYVNYVNLRSGRNIGDAIAFSNFPTWWRELYLSQNLIHEDVILRHCDSLRSKLVETETSDQQLVFDPILKDRLSSMANSGFRNGFVSPTSVIDDGRVSGWCFGSSMNKTEFVKAYAKFGTVLRLISLCAHERIETFMLSLASNSDATSCLSGREQECLTHLACGKRSPRIAHMMGISLSTVEFHIKGIKKKLKAATREEAVAKAITLGHISYSA